MSVLVKSGEGGSESEYGDGALIRLLTFQVGGRRSCYQVCMLRGVLFGVCFGECMLRGLRTSVILSHRFYMARECAHEQSTYTRPVAHQPCPIQFFSDPARTRLSAGHAERGQPGGGHGPTGGAVGRRRDQKARGAGDDADGRQRGVGAPLLSGAIADPSAVFLCWTLKFCLVQSEDAIVAVSPLICTCRSWEPQAYGQDADTAVSLPAVHLQELGIADVRAGLAPEDKLAAVRSLRSDAPPTDPGGGLCFACPFACLCRHVVPFNKLAAVRSLRSDAPPTGPGEDCPFPLHLFPFQQAGCSALAAPRRPSRRPRWGPCHPLWLADH